ncbi:MAG: hypothetical protein AAF627_19615 [Myxococcota bacterium]
MQTRRFWPRSWPLILLLCACDGESFSEEVFIDQAIDLDGVSTVFFETDVGLDIQGSRGNEVTLLATIELTASSTESLQLARQAFGLEAEREGSSLLLRLQAPGGIGFDFEQARLSGVLEVGLPRDVDVDARVIGGGIRALDMESDLVLRAAGPVNADPAQGDATISAGSGGAFVRALLSSGRDVRVQVNAGNLELVLPRGLSARVRAESRAGSIVLDHPELPLLPSGRPYDATIGRGGADVQALTLRGDILLRD